MTPSTERAAGWSAGGKPAPYDLGAVRVATFALLTVTMLSAFRSCGVVIARFSGHAVTLRRSPTVFADTPIPGSTFTRIWAGNPPKACGERRCFWACIA